MKGLHLPRWLAIGIAVITVAGLSACGGSSSPNPVAGDLAPLDQQVLRLRLNGEPKTIDPALTNIVSETTVTKSLFAGLYTYDEDLKIVPNLATALPTVDNGGVSKDGMTYTVQIASDAKWSDGKVVTAQDFVYSMKRALDPKLGSPYVSFFYGIAGAKAYNQALGTAAAPKTPSDADLAAMQDGVGVIAKDERTVVYQLTQPDPSFLNKLALWTAYPVRQDIIEKFGAKWTEAGNLVGNGPFMLKEWTHDQRFVFEPNPYWGGAKPQLQQVVINFIADEAAAYAAYLNNELDSVVVPASARREVDSPSSPLNAELHKFNDLNTFALMMNGAQAPFDNVKVRQAFGMAIDRKAMVDGLLQGAGMPTTAWIPPGMPGYDATLGSQYEFNPTKAKQLLAEAGYPDGKGLPTVTFISTSSDSNKLRGQFIEDQLKKNLGVEVVNEYVDAKTFGSRFTANQYQVSIQNWSGDWPYPDNWLPDLFGSEGLNNHFGYKNAQFDDLVARAAKETDSKKRLDLYAQAQKQVLDDAVLVPLYNRSVYLLVKPKVKDLIGTGIDGAIKGDYFFFKTYIAK